jgi:hypothetical protein
VLYAPIGGTSSIYYLLLCYRKHVNRTTGSIAWKMWTERLYSLSFCVVPFFFVSVLHPERFSWYNSFRFIQSGKKKSFFKYEGIIFPRKVKLFCFGKVCYFHAIQMCCMYAEVATSSILLFLGRKEIGGIYESYCIAWLFWVSRTWGI